MPDPIFITLEEVLAVHKESLVAFGGSDGIRDTGALESAVNAPINYFHYQQATIVTCAAVYLHHISEAQAFIDGNKRTAVAVTLMFLLANGVGVIDDQQGIYDLLMKIANHEIEIDEISISLNNFITE